MTDSVYWEDDDLISETGLAAQRHPNETDFVETGFSLTADHTNEQFDITAGKAHIGWTDGNGFQRGKVVERDVSTTVGFATTSGTNYAYVSTKQSSVDGDPVAITVESSQSPPSDPFGDGSAVASLLLGSVDAGADASAVEVNRGPDIDSDSITTDDVTVNNSLSLGTDTALTDVVASGSVTLSSGSATIDTGVGSGTTATFMVAFGPTTDDAQVAADIQAVSGGNYTVDVEETDTSVGNPTVEYDIIRVR